MRKILSLVLIVILLVIVIPGIVDSYARVQPEKPTRYTMHLVKKGDTLWAMSEKYMPGVDPRIGVHWIRESNGLSPQEVIDPGDRLNVPCESGDMLEPYGQD